MKTHTAGWVCWAQARDNSTTLQHAANSLQNYAATNRAAPLIKARACRRRGKDATREPCTARGPSPKRRQGESRHAHSHGTGREALGSAVTAVSPTPRGGRRHSGGHGRTWAHADATRAESGKRGWGLPFTRSSACSCNNCCCRISNCLCSSSNCRLMYSWRHGQQGSKEKEREGKRASISQEEGE